MSRSILRIDASPRVTGSVTRRLADHFEASWTARHPEDRFLRRDLANMRVPHLDEPTITGFYTPAEQMTEALRIATATSDTLIAELLAADALLIATPMYNFSVPSALKAWIDQVVRAGRTFTYDGVGFVGLVTGRPAYVLSAYGVAGYGAGESLAAFNFLDPYLRGLLGFLGFTAIHGVGADGTAGDAAAVEAGIARAAAAIDEAIAGDRA